LSAIYIFPEKIFISLLWSWQSNANAARSCARSSWTNSRRH